MQRLCWEICVSRDVFDRKKKNTEIGAIDLDSLFKMIALETGQTIYAQLECGPQKRRERITRRLKSGQPTDIYKAILSAIAATGPATIVDYETIRTKLSEIMQEIPRKHEITSALIHLSKMSRDIGHDAGIDWVEDERKVNVSDPYLRFYLRWHVRPGPILRPLLHIPTPELVNRLLSGQVRQLTEDFDRLFSAKSQPKKP